MRRNKEDQEEPELPESRIRELGLTETEQKDIKELGRPKAVVIHEIIRLAGEHELQRPVLALA